MNDRFEDEKETWSFLKVMFEDDGTARTKLLAHLGFSVADESQDGDKLGMEVSQKLSVDEKTLVEAPHVGTGDSGPFDFDSGENFFNNPHPEFNNFTAEASNVPVAEKVQLEPEESAESVDSVFDDGIRHALIVGDYKGAVSQCISANRMADALVIAQMGGASLWESTRDQYLRKSSVSYLKVVILILLLGSNLLKCFATLLIL